MKKIHPHIIIWLHLFYKYKIISIFAYGSLSLPKNHYTLK